MTSTVVAASPATFKPVADAFADVAARLRQSTVQVRGQGPGGGSGIIWSADGLIVTNAHVARETTAIVELADGQSYPARMLARDTERDLALLKIDAYDLPAVTVGDARDLRVGQLVLAVGNPLGVVGAVSIGIIHSTRASDPDRPVVDQPTAQPSPRRAHGEGGRSGPSANHQEWVAADISLAPGNSGGPLADASGRVLGVNSMIAGGLGLAVPSYAVVEMVQNLERRPSFGVTVQPISVPSAVEGGHAGPRLGLLIVEVELDSVADRAGLMLGDILLGYAVAPSEASQPFRQPTDLIRAWRQVPTGGAITLAIQRAGQAQSVAVVAINPETPRNASTVAA